MEIDPQGAILLPPRGIFSQGSVLYYGGRIDGGVWNWDIATGTSYPADLPPPGTLIDLHSTGHSILYDGSVLFAGSETPNNLIEDTCGKRHIHIYNPWIDDAVNAGAMTYIGHMEEAR